DSGATVFKIDPQWHFEYSEEALGRSLEHLTCPVMLVHGENSHVVTRKQAERARAQARSAEGTALFSIPKCGHYILEDSPLKFRDSILRFVSAHDDAFTVINQVPPAADIPEWKQEARKPEMLGIRPLPEYPTLGDAIKALAPRKIPTAEMIEEELAKLRMEDDVPSDEDEYGNRRTALAQDDPEYFGFVG
ncbi:hypothetical protein CYMTET_44456, partial [Cymbomonas tetramitiformis]